MIWRYATHYWQVADSSELNGTYKMALTRAKEVHFLAKPPGHRGWSSTDIIPLVNFAYPLSFGIVERGKKAIRNRGWGPLNYTLLRNADILSTKGRPAEQETSEPTGGGGDSSTVDVRTHATALNTQKGYAAELLEGIVREAMKDDGRRDKIRQKMQAEVAVADTAMQLKKMTKVSSGGLASCGMYHIDSEIHTEVRERKEQRMAGDAATLQKRTVREERIVASQRVSLEKRQKTARCSMPQGDMQRIASSLKRQGDSPNKKTKAATEAQLQRRELREAKQKDSKAQHLEDVDIRVLLEELYVEGDDGEVALMLKSREELEVELHRRRNRSIM
jgi:hypothetical protein